MPAITTGTEHNRNRYIYHKIHFTKSCTLCTIHKSESGMLDTDPFSTDYSKFPLSVPSQTILHTHTFICDWRYVLSSTATIITPYAHVIYNMIIKITWFLLNMHQSVLALLLTSCGAVGISVGRRSWSSAILWQFPFLGTPLESRVNCDVAREMFACKAWVCQGGCIWC